MTTSLIYRNTNRSKTWQIHQEVIHKITEFPIVMTSYDCSQGDPIFTSKRMITNKSIESPVVRIWKIILPFYFKRHIQISDTLFKPFYTRLVTILPKERIYLVLMDDTFQPTNENPRHKLRL